MSDFLYEGGYASYVWSAFAISALSLTLLGFWIAASYRKAVTKLARYEDRKGTTP
jgi:heme exporter protein CcmD